MRFADLPVPDSPAATAALEVATEYSSPALLNHSIRAYYWAAAYGEQREIDFDVELLYVAALLHDLGLSQEFDSHTVPFEEAGGHVAWVFGAGAGWPRERRQRVSEVIVRHMWRSVDAGVDPEGHLLEVATGMEISGRNTDAIPSEVRAEVLERYPRLDLVDVFLGLIDDQVARKPDCLAAGYARSGLDANVRANPLNS